MALSSASIKPDSSLLHPCTQAGENTSQGKCLHFNCWPQTSKVLYTAHKAYIPSHLRGGPRPIAQVLPGSLLKMQKHRLHPDLQIRISTWTNVPRWFISTLKVHKHCPVICFLNCQKFIPRLFLSPHTFWIPVRSIAQPQAPLRIQK